MPLAALLEATPLVVHGFKGWPQRMLMREFGYLGDKSKSLGKNSFLVRCLGALQRTVLMQGNLC